MGNARELKLEIYFDYLCEFCEKGHRYWTELLPKFPQIVPVWRPCEAHPRAYEPHFPRHSDLAIQGLFFVCEQGGNAALYNELVFAAAWQQRKNMEDMALLAECAARAGVDAHAFVQAIGSGEYTAALEQANAHAWEKLGLQAVPSFILEDGRRLDALLGQGVTKERLEQFLQSAL